MWTGSKKVVKIVLSSLLHQPLCMTIEHYPVGTKHSLGVYPFKIVWISCTYNNCNLRFWAEGQWSMVYSSECNSGVAWQSADIFLIGMVWLIFIPVASCQCCYKARCALHSLDLHLVQWTRNKPSPVAMPMTAYNHKRIWPPWYNQTRPTQRKCSSYCVKHSWWVYFVIILAIYQLELDSLFNQI